MKDDGLPLILLTTAVAIAIVWVLLLVAGIDARFRD